MTQGTGTGKKETRIEPVRNESAGIEPVRFEVAAGMVLAGLNVRYTAGTMRGIAEQWNRFGPHIGKIAGQVGNVAYGVCHHMQGAGLEYLTAVQVRGSDVVSSYGATSAGGVTSSDEVNGSGGVSNSGGVSRPDGLPAGFETLKLEAHRYAVFAHDGHVSAIRNTLEAIDTTWTPKSAHLLEPTNDGLAFFERYGEDFNPVTGVGNIEVWVRVKNEK